MNFRTSAPIHTLGDYQIRKVHGSCWDGVYVVIRATDEDVLSMHGGKESAISRMADLDCGLITESTKAERLAQLANVPTEALTGYLATLDPFHDWKAVRDIKTALATRQN
jgi:hypothetical protein